MSFSNDFIWGAATAAYQIEGAYKEDGKGLNIWDVTSKNKGAVRYGENGNIACDHYHRYKEDIKIFKEMGLKYYRFSINWARVIPDGIGKVNEAGLKFYSELVDELISAGIEPMVTLYHWDLPYELYLKGGWANREIAEWFLEYTKVIVDTLSDRVKYWFTLNEPQCFIGMGYAAGKHAPFLQCDNKTVMIMVHNALIAHGKAVKYIRENAKAEPKIGFSPVAPCFVPKDNTKEEIEIARKNTFSCLAGTFSISLFSDPIFFGKYPDEAYELFGEDMVVPKEGDMEIIKQPLDFYGMNLYFSMAKRVEDGYRENEYQGMPRNSMDWVIDEEIMYWSPKFVYERYGLPIIITENGFANCDIVSLDGEVHDPQRIDFIHRYLRRYKDVAKEVPIMGYLYWSALDNFEWEYGYDKRFGLVHVDYSTQKRTIKDSGYWYKSVIESNGENL